MTELQTAIERGDVVDFRAICKTLEPRELFSVWIRVSRQPSLAAAAQKILLERNIIRR